jgi:exopolysaccharide production protein ExoQ
MHSTRIGALLQFAGFALIGAVALLEPRLAIFLVGLGTVVVLHKTGLLMSIAVMVLVLVPMRSVFSARAAELTSTAVMAQDIETGDPLRRAAILALFPIGLLLLSRARFKLGRATVPAWFSVYLLLCLISLLWSEDPALTARRVATAIAVAVFAEGLAVGNYGRRRDGGIRLARDICLVGSLGCGAVLAVAISQGKFHVFDFGWRLGSNGHENQISWLAALPFLTAWVTRNNRDIWQKRCTPAAILAVGGSVLLFSKSRTTILAAAAGVLVAELLSQRVTRRLARLAVLSAVLVVIISGNWFHQFWRRGASEDMLRTASGRTELWETVWHDVCEKPLVGYGYGAYWSPRRVKVQAVEWAPTSAHNGYLETAAELGLTGLVVLIVFIVLCSRNAWLLIRRGNQNRDIGVLLLVLVTSLLVINATETYVQGLEYFPVLATLTVAFYVSYLYGRLPVPARRPIVAGAVVDPRLRPSYGKSNFQTASLKRHFWP